MIIARTAFLAALLASTAATAQDGSFVHLDGRIAKPLFSSIFDAPAPATGDDSSIEVLKDDLGMVVATIHRRPMPTTAVVRPAPVDPTPVLIVESSDAPIEYAVPRGEGEIVTHDANALPPAMQLTSPTAGNDRYDVADLATVIVDDGGWDTITSSIGRDLADFPGIENVTLTGDADIDAVGDVNANRLTGNAGRNRLEGLGGADILVGGEGDDTYVLAAALNDSIDDVEGDDTIESTIGRDLADFAGIENLVLTHSANVDGFGDEGANRLTGNAGTNALDGRDGDDVIDGGKGPDMLTGGAGKDVFVLAAAADSKTAAGHRDVITDFVAGEDRIDLSALADGFDLALIGDADFTGAAGEIRWFKKNKDYLIIEVDIDGDLDADAQIEIAPVRKITEADLILTPHAVI